MKKKYDIVLIGAIADIDLVYANAILSQTKELNILIVRKHKYKINDGKLKLYPYIKESHIYYNDSSVKFFFKIALKTKVILSFTGSAMGQFKIFFLYKIITGYPKIINRTTGADFAEFLLTNNLYNFIYKIFLKFCDTHNIGYMDDHIKNSIKIRLKDIFFLSVPFVKTLEFKDKYEYNYIFEKHKEKVVFFMPSNILIEDKKNLTFIEPFIKSLKHRKDIFCILIDNGLRDVKIIKDIISKNEAKDSFFWIPHRLKKDELHNYILKSDIVVDQFNAGSFGGIAVETLLLNKYLITYLNEQNIHLAHSSIPPIFNSRNVDEIYKFILTIRKNDIVKKEKDIEIWVNNELSNKKIVLTLLYHASRISGENLLGKMRW